MVGFVRIISENFNLKKPKKNENNVFTIFSLINATIEEAETLTIDTELSIKLPEDSKAFLATKFGGQEIQKFIGPNSCKKRLWLTLPNESYFNKHHINKGDVIGYLVIEPGNIKAHYKAKKRNP